MFADSAAVRTSLHDLGALPKRKYTVRVIFLLPDIFYGNGVLSDVLLYLKLVTTCALGYIQKC
jgi:hypothetical protein